MTSQTNELKLCPCGKTPATLCLTEQGAKWGWATGTCCGEWSVEFRTQYDDYGTDEYMEHAVGEWNRAPRQTRSPDTDLREAAKVYGEYINFLNNANDGPIKLAYVHGWRCSDEDMAKGEEFRVRINKLLRD